MVEIADSPTESISATGWPYKHIRRLSHALDKERVGIKKRSNEEKQFIHLHNNLVFYVQ